MKYWISRRERIRNVVTQETGRMKADTMELKDYNWNGLDKEIGLGRHSWKSATRGAKKVEMFERWCVLYKDS